MFRGLSQVLADAKGRFSVPTRYRSDIMARSKGSLVITIDNVAPCLLLYTLSEWEIIEKKLQQLPSLDPKTRRIQRLLIGHATEVVMDSVGRVLIPSVLREYAQLEKNMLLVGQGNKFEIWSETLWEEQRSGWLDNESTDNNEIPESLKNLSL